MVFESHLKRGTIISARADRQTTIFQLDLLRQKKSKNHLVVKIFNIHTKAHIREMTSLNADLDVINNLSNRDSLGPGLNLELDPKTGSD